MGSCRMRCRQCLCSVLIAMCFLAQLTEIAARTVPLPAAKAVHNDGHQMRGLRFLVQETTVLTYHNGSVLTGSGTPPAVNVYLIWYGNFSDAQRAVILDFFTSTQFDNCTSPSVADWWKMTCGYKDSAGAGVPPQAIVQAEMTDATCSKGKTLLAADLESLVTGSLTTFPVDAESIYVVLTDEDVVVDDFCNSQCGSHYSTAASATTQNKQLAYGWVGNPATQCPGKCAWPYAQPKEGEGPANAPLLPPNGDVGMDGMVINLASILAGTVTNPFNDGWFQGDATAPNEASSACVGMFGPGSYPGYAGQLLSSSTGESFNAWGVNSRKYLLPALWDPSTSNCTPPQ